MKKVHITSGGIFFDSHCRARLHQCIDACSNVILSMPLSS